MSDRPILFSGPMVRAIADGQKTQTRRVLRTLNDTPFENLGLDDPDHYSGRADDPDSWGYPYADDGGPMRLPEVALWQYVVGDRLYVRETFSGPHGCRRLPPREWPPHGPRWYWADGESKDGDWTKPKPGMHMPRSSSRLTLPVVDVRVERLQDISEEDAIAEGVERDTDGWRDYQMPTTQCCGTARDSYRTLWDSLNAKRGYGWDVNPWVVAITFEVQHCNIDAPFLPAGTEIGWSKRAAVREVV